MQLTKVHLFLILIFALILASSLGNYVRDGFTTTKPTELPPQLRAVDTRIAPGNTRPTAKYDPNINAGVNPAEVGSPVSSFSPSTFPYNAPAGIPGVDSVTGNDQAGKDMECKPKQKCPPCPACARCPEPSFECKKVPTYSNRDNSNLPRPIMADFSQFGM
jgi:hypothetical protein